VLAATSAAGITLPDVVIALALLLLALKTHIAPVGGMVSARAEESSGWTKTLDILKHMVLPVAALVISLLPVLLRHVRAALAEALSAPYIQAARAHGISRQRILWRHALPATAGPLISLMGVSIGTLVSASILVEILMSWPGLGPLMLEAIFARDAYIVIGVVLTSSLVLVGGNLLSDVLLVVVDPRIRKP
jgi:peptide/nickel transport system permease protein